ncbi:MAG: tRNA (N(6)-L-threonylcarbamoyladenosine(37)-C(2))-methylthiotransferase MtaB [Lentisphaeria bacterium]
MTKVSIFTLGCRLNQAESALIADDLRRAGYELVSWGKPVELAVINSCLVTAAAGQKTRQAVRRARRDNPAAYVVLAGCSAELEADKWGDEEAVDLIVPNRAKTRLTALLPEELISGWGVKVATAPESASDMLFTEDGCGFYPGRTRANLKIQEGCDFFCTYCIVPYTRGKPRSRAWADVVREARELITRGHKEIVLTGVNIAGYEDAGRTLSDLLEELLLLDGEFRLRLSSTEPCPELPRVVEVMQQSTKICRFLHVPMQYGEDEILRRMNRRYSVRQYRDFIRETAEQIEDICIGSDVIVGFPGETPAHFERCLETVRDLPLAYLHIFRYSARPGTPAADFSGQVHGDIISARRQCMQELADTKARAFTESMQGKRVTLLTEAVNENGRWEGWTDNYLRAELSNGPSNLQANEFVQAEIIKSLDGRCVKCKK